MAYESFTVEVDSDGIALVTIDLPGQSMNVWNETLMEEFGNWVDTFIADDDIKGAVIASGKRSGFMAGADLRMIGTMNADTSPEAFESGFFLNRLFRKMETGGIPQRLFRKERHSLNPLLRRLKASPLAVGSSLFSPVITVLSQTIRKSSWACLRLKSACYPAAAEHSERRAWPVCKRRR